MLRPLLSGKHGRKFVALEKARSPGSGTSGCELWSYTGSSRWDSFRAGRIREAGRATGPGVWVAFPSRVDKLHLTNRIYPLSYCRAAGAAPACEQTAAALGGGTMRLHVCRSQQGPAQLGLEVAGRTSPRSPRAWAQGADTRRTLGPGLYDSERSRTYRSGRTAGRRGERESGV